ncbi:hypothetical protein ACTU45_14130 [Streptomyces sp. 24-1644]|uniref:PLL-like beta propeller domain-containing protein n=2 Tax=Streptomyces TaxID=1883 RepID=A0ABV3M2M4_9ACTN|nr:hypothetical protein [Streptomyces sp. WAC 01529]
MRGFKSALATVAALAAFAGVGVAASPAQAATYCSTKGQTYICEYGVSTMRFANGTKEEFVVGADHAVWTNWTRSDGSWNGWMSMGGWVQSRIYATPEQENSTSLLYIIATGSDGNDWARVRHSNGYWTSWQPRCFAIPEGHNCA